MQEHEEHCTKLDFLMLTGMLGYICWQEGL